MKLLLIINSPEFFLTHRLPLALAARDAGVEVEIATGPGLACEKIRNLGFVHHLLPLKRSSVNPLLEFYSLVAFWKLMRSVKPNLLHLVTIKPAIYGSLTARLAKVPAVLVAISGLGSTFVTSGKKISWLRRVVEFLYKQAFRHPNIRVVFQNESDRSLLINLEAIKADQSYLIRGSGVSLTDYPFKPEPCGEVVVTFASRLLVEKGVLEFIDSARILKRRGLSIRFWLVGELDLENPSSVKWDDITFWHESGLVEYLGFRSDISEIFANSNIVVLPSYYGEGLPKVLIEAAACGRAVVTTDMPGCRDAIRPNISGVLVPDRNAEKLADAIERLVFDSDLRQAMGKAGRDLAKHDFTIEKVVSSHMKIYSELTGFNFVH